MKKASNIIWGVVLVVLGVIFGLNALKITNIDIFFDGWWTLFIIIPCTVGLFTERDKTGNLICIAIGVFLLLGCQDIISFSLMWKLLVPVVIIIIGIRLVINGMFGNKANEMLSKLKDSGNSLKTCTATFSGSKLNYNGERFDGAELNAIFGGVECDLRNAVIEKDCAVKATAVFGGIDIFVPDNINVKVNSNSIFGGVSNKTAIHSDAPTVYVTATCMFGGIEIK